MTPSHPLPSEPDLAALREALKGILGECEEWTMYQHGNPSRIIDAIEGRCRAALAANPEPARDGLDVERLTEALFQIHHVIPWRWWDGSDVTGTSVEFAAEIARQYARLSPPVDRDAPREPV